MGQLLPSPCPTWGWQSHYPRAAFFPFSRSQKHSGGTHGAVLAAQLCLVVWFPLCLAGAGALDLQGRGRADLIRQ